MSHPPGNEPGGPATSWTTDFYRASVDDLRNLPAPNISDKSVAERIDDERLNELRDARRYRRAIVIFTLITVGSLVAAATAFMITYVVSQWEHIEASVMIAYFTSIVVESIGILYVISRYLFPQSGPHHDEDEAVSV